MTNASWTDGYTSDISYTSGYYSTQSPLMIKLAMLSRGIKPIDLSDYRYMELGYGQGLSLNIHAAASGKEFWGTDFNPNHATIAMQYAKASGADVKVLDASFEDLAARDDLPEFDLISMHGVWSWISEKNQNLIVDLLKKKLKVGGALQISYNCYPGWAAMVPLQHLMNLHRKTVSDKGQDPRVALQNAFGFVSALANADAGFFQANPEVKGQLDRLGQQDSTYLVHELFHDKWPVTPFSDVAEKLSEAKMSFVGPASLLEHIDVFTMPQQHLQMVNSIGDQTLRESVRDFCMNRRFRSDIFTKGAQTITREERDEELRKMLFVLVRHPDTLNYEKLEISPNETLNLKKKFMDPVVKALSENNFAPKTVAEIEKHEAVKDLNIDQLAEVLVTLTGAFVIAPAQEDAAVSNAEKTCKALNSELTDQIKRNNVTNAIASPLIGGGFGITSTQLLFLDAAMNGKKSKKETIAHSWEIMQKIGWRALEDGQQIQDEKKNIERLEEEFTFFNDKRMPLLKAHRVV